MTNYITKERKYHKCFKTFLNLRKLWFCKKCPNVPPLPLYIYSYATLFFCLKMSSTFSINMEKEVLLVWKSTCIKCFFPSLTVLLFWVLWLEIKTWTKELLTGGGGFLENFLRNNFLGHFNPLPSDFKDLPYLCVLFTFSVQCMKCRFFEMLSLLMCSVVVLGYST